MKLFKKSIKFSTIRKDIRNSFQGAAVKNGAFSITAIVVVIIIAVVANLLFDALPSKVRQMDISDNKIYEISDSSKKLLKNLDEDITITVIAESDTVDVRLETFLEKYVELSDKITMETIDPVLHPSALTDYETETDTIIVSCDATGLSTQVSFNDILIRDMSSYYYYGSTDITSFDGDGQLTSAINKVTGMESKKICYLTDHGESELPSSIQSLMTKSGFSMESLSLLMSGEIPEDCDMLLLNGVVSDITQQEEELIDKYIKNGGNVVILLSEKGPESGNITELLAKYKITQEKGYAADMQRNYQGSYYDIFPSIAGGEEFTEGIETGLVLMSNCRGCTLGESEGEISTQPILETSNQGYMVTDSEEQQGVFTIGAHSSYTAEETSDETSDGEESAAESVTGNLIVYGSDTIIDETITGVFSGLDNNTLFMNSITAAFDDVENNAAEAKNLSVQYNTPQHGGFISAFIIFILPIGVLIYGFIKWRKRRKA